MPVPRSSLLHCCLVSILLLPAVTAAQNIQIKTIPVATGDQFLILPTRNDALGGVSIALDDSLADPFINPARGGVITTTRFFCGSAFYSSSGNDGSGVTYPVGLLYRKGRWHGGACIALQSLTPAMHSFPWYPESRILEWALTDPSAAPNIPPLKQVVPANRYYFATLGRELPGTTTTVGAAVSTADLNALDGVDLLYAGSVFIAQQGRSLDLRLGLTTEPPTAGIFEALAFYSNLNMTHEVYYPEFASPTAGFNNLLWTTRKTHRDRTHTFGLHLGRVYPPDEQGLRRGWIITGNMKTHPAIPEYELADLAPIPRDPGYSFALNLGLGLAYTAAPLTFGLDVIYEPQWVETWGEAEEAIWSRAGVQIPAGGKTVQNSFRFNNLRLRFGLALEARSWGIRGGIDLHAIDYDLDQYSHLTGKDRSQFESWIETTPTVGLHVRGKGCEIRYTGRLQLGTGSPGGWLGEEYGTWSWTVRSSDPWDQEGNLCIDPAGPGGDILFAPTSQFGVEFEHVVSHQIAVIIPLGQEER